ncbi:5-oxoprolinase [Histoplasma capsulatum G186AR]|uniref:5-oxoprolinase n=1 Tax=Ajellomyces capsulatus TaxID=5037 RepID=A0A8H8D718_AJECA|nr:5-oxoprolinase [Histoplasma capsulatum]QSS69620.1 5-oxoprolinase [Histoplasma capsulatum G186AR]
MHGYTFPDHETLIGRLARQTGFDHISLSHELFPVIKLVPRATSDCADAYLTPAIRKYIPGFQAGFEGRLGASSLKEEHGSKRMRCEFMQLDGDLVDIDSFSGLRAILLGLAGGVVGYGLPSYVPLTDIPVIGFGMGVTSTDVSRYGSVMNMFFKLQQMASRYKTRSSILILWLLVEAHACFTEMVCSRWALSPLAHNLVLPVIVKWFANCHGRESVSRAIVTCFLS